MALGRLSGDRESVALLACGVSPMRVLRPLLVLGLLVAGLDMYVLDAGGPGRQPRCGARSPSGS